MGMSAVSWQAGADSVMFWFCAWCLTPNLLRYPTVGLVTVLDYCPDYSGILKMIWLYGEGKGEGEGGFEFVYWSFNVSIMY